MPWEEIEVNITKTISRAFSCNIAFAHWNLHLHHVITRLVGRFVEVR